VTKLIEDKIGFTVSTVGTAVAMALALPASADTLSVTGSFMQYLDDDDRAYAEECAECNSDTDPIRGNPVTFDSFNGFSGDIKWNRDLGKGFQAVGFRQDLFPGCTPFTGERHNNSSTEKYAKCCYGKSSRRIVHRSLSPFDTYHGDSACENLSASGSLTL